MFRWVLLILTFFTLPLAAQELEAPSNWREEIISLPPDFAPSMSWKGREILRFSPGMFEPQSEDFFSYVFLLELQPGSKADWGEQLPLYYAGLAKAVLKNQNLDTSDFRLKLEGEEHSQYGTLEWTEPFKTKTQQTLFLELRKVDERRWFVCASPAVPTSSIWTKMRRIRNSVLL